MIRIYIKTDHITALKIATQTKTLAINLFFDRASNMYYVNVATISEMNQIADILHQYGLLNGR